MENSIQARTIGELFERAIIDGIVEDRENEDNSKRQLRFC